MVRRRFLSSVLSLYCVSAVLPAYAAPRQRSKPMVLVFASGQEGSKGVAAADTLSPLERNIAAARAIRDRLEDSNAVSGVLFNVESPLFQRAAQEAQVKLDAKRGELSNAERVGIAKAAGAIYCVIVTLQPLGVEANAWEMAITGINPKTNKNYTDRVRYTGLGGGVPPPDPNGVQEPQPRTDPAASPLISAANTLVLRVLAGPLGDYGRVAPPPGALPAPAPGVAVAPEGDENITALLEEGRELIAQGDATGAITLLRRAVNRTPLQLRPRMLLAQAYLTAHRAPEAAAEVRRALQLTPPQDVAGRREVMNLLAEACTQSGDIAAARTAYEQVIATTPDSAEINWARLALANLYLERANKEGASAQFRAILRTDRRNREAAIGLAKILAETGDFVNVLAEIAPQAPDGTPADKATRNAAAVILFEVAAPELARLLKANRSAWENKQISREIFYKATRTQAGRASALMTMVKSAAPDVPESDPAFKLHGRRILAASLLTQSFTAMQTYLETGNEDANAQSSLCLLEFEREFAGLIPTTPAA